MHLPTQVSNATCATTLPIPDPKSTKVSKFVSVGIAASIAEPQLGKSYQHANLVQAQVHVAPRQTDSIQRHERSSYYRE
ncbi:unnamed protein product [Phytophthora fragariaefolia]|uniref:Unnamed protein product n=1 Tax=Phytophthora fragariaefolia TaxID=1490495 RepID=A0A9W6YLS5_9STRA|nr:unnamed protein product [Phytophthora fragariaefolia]